MGPRFLIDTNILVYYYEGLIPANTVQEVDEILRQSFNVSIISKIEFLGWPKYDEEQYQKAVLFIEGAVVISLSEEIEYRWCQVHYFTFMPAKLFQIFR